MRYRERIDRETGDCLKRDRRPFQVLARVLSLYKLETVSCPPISRANFLRCQLRLVFHSDFNKLYIQASTIPLLLISA